MTGIPIDRWRAFRVKIGVRNPAVHIVGYSPAEDIGVVTGAIKEWNPVTRELTTVDGLVYRLSDSGGGHSRDADHAWTKWCARNRVGDIINVTGRYEINRKIAKAVKPGE